MFRKKRDPAYELTAPFLPTLGSSQFELIADPNATQVVPADERKTVVAMPAYKGEKTVISKAQKRKLATEIINEIERSLLAAESFKKEHIPEEMAKEAAVLNDSFTKLAIKLKGIPYFKTEWEAVFVIIVKNAVRFERAVKLGLKSKGKELEGHTKIYNETRTRLLFLLYSKTKGKKRSVVKLLKEMRKRLKSKMVHKKAA